MHAARTYADPEFSRMPMRSGNLRTITVRRNRVAIVSELIDRYGALRGRLTIPPVVFDALARAVDHALHGDGELEFQERVLIGHAGPSELLIVGRALPASVKLQHLVGGVARNQGVAFSDPAELEALGEAVAYAQQLCT